MRAVIYTRVSTSDKEQDPMNQLVPLRKLAEALGYEVTQEYTEYASGGNSNRPQFQAMLNGVKKRSFDIVLIWSLDRFSREGILNTLSYLKTFKNNGVNIKSLQESWLDTRDEGIGQIMISIFAWVAAQENKKISERVKAGLKNAKNVGKRGKDKKPRKRQGYFK